MPFRARKNYRAAASRYYRRRNLQAKKRQFRKFTRQQKVSIKTIKTIAKREAAKLDKKKIFKNWCHRVLGTYFDSDVAVGRPLSALGIANRPTPFLIGAGDGANDLWIERVHSLEEAGPDPVETLQYKRKSSKIYCTKINVKGVFLLPLNMGYEYIRWTCVEVKIPLRAQPNATDLATMINTDLCTSARSGFITPTQEERALKNKDHVVARKTFRVSNPMNQVEMSKTFDFSVNLKNKMIEYSDEDVDGTLPLNRFYWHAFTCWGRHDSNQGVPGASAPQVTANVVLSYHEKLD